MRLLRGIEIDRPAWNDKSFCCIGSAEFAFPFPPPKFIGIIGAPVGLIGGNPNPLLSLLPVPNEKEPTAGNADVVGVLKLAGPADAKMFVAELKAAKGLLAGVVDEKTLPVGVLSVLLLVLLTVLLSALLLVLPNILLPVLPIVLPTALLVVLLVPKLNALVAVLVLVGALKPNVLFIGSLVLVEDPKLNTFELEDGELLEVVVLLPKLKVGTVDDAAGFVVPKLKVDVEGV